MKNFRLVTSILRLFAYYIYTCFYILLIDSLLLQFIISEFYFTLLIISLFRFFKFKYLLHSGKYKFPIHLQRLLVFLFMQLEKYKSRIQFYRIILLMNNDLKKKKQKKKKSEMTKMNMLLQQQHREKALLVCNFRFSFSFSLLLHTETSYTECQRKSLDICTK